MTTLNNEQENVITTPPLPHQRQDDNYIGITIHDDHFSGAFRRIKSKSELLQHHSLLRTNKKRYGPLYMLTSELKQTYSVCNHTFKYNATNNPRRVLTKPSKATQNDGYDNDDFDYILYVNDILGSTEGHKYYILDVLGSGTFGQVVKCRNIKTDEIVAVKVVKNKLAYFKQSMMEVAILEMLNSRYDPSDKHHLLRLKDTFIHKKHLCLVFELLSVNLYELIKQNHFRGLSTNLVRVFTSQILDALTILNEARIIHCDLKPENILLKNLESPTIKVIDFGSACHEVQTMYTYIQSRFYRSPEVLIGLPYTSAIDMWSLGCIATELFLGLPLFPGSSEYNQLSRIIELFGPLPSYMIDVGKNSSKYFDKSTYQFKSLDTYSREQGKMEQPSKRYFNYQNLTDLINHYPIMRQLNSKEIEKEKLNRLAFIDFLQGCLNLNPIERWSPQQAKQHPFITGEPFTRPFQPPYIPRTSTSNTAAKRSSSFISPLPSVIEPSPSYSNSLLQQQPHYMPPIMQQQPLQPQTSNRPRANTLGTMQQVPPQIQQWSSSNDGSGIPQEGTLYSPYYPHEQHSVDLERDGDWQEESRRVSRHRRSNSNTTTFRNNIPVSSISSSLLSQQNTNNNRVSSFHRFMRGHYMNHRQDIEWDGVHYPPSSTKDDSDNDWMMA